MEGLKAELLRGLWYVAGPGAELRLGRMRAKVIFGEPVLLGRTRRGQVFAVRDICPHRGMPLHYGKFDGETITCAYHGWRFDQSGTCVEIPSLYEGQKVDLAKIRCGPYACVERQGLIWTYIAANGEAPTGEAAEPPLIPLVGEGQAPTVHIEQRFPCSIDHAAFGLMDPGHIAYVHTSRWYRGKSHVVRPKEKSFEPIAFGFRMVRHHVTAQNLLYRLLGAHVTTEISYRLPGLRIEDIQGDRHAVVTVSALTPISQEETAFHQMIWATPSWATAFKPVVRMMANVFLNQDRSIAVRQREGLVREPRLMLINDVNTQARWWMQLKHEWIAAGQETRAFVNPLKPMTLRWRS